MSRRIGESPRGRKKRSIRPVILIVSEGTVTEPLYFEHYKDRYLNVHIIPASYSVKGTGKKTDYNHLVKEAIRLKQQKDLSVEDGDSIWCIFDADVDTKTPGAAGAKNRQLQLAKQEADKHGISLALSNPCFEVWFLLHFEYTTKQFYSYDEMRKRLNYHLGRYDKIRMFLNKYRRKRPMQYTTVGS